MQTGTNLAAMIALAAIGTPALAGYSIMQGDTPAPTYTSGSLDFDQPDDPAPGFGGVDTEYWLASQGVTLMAGDSVLGAGQVNDWDALFAGGAGWLGDGNSLRGPFGQLIFFESDVDAVSLQVWNNSGPPSPIGGGMVIRLLNDGVEVADLTVTPAWGTDLGSYFHIVADGGDTFDQVNIFDLGTGSNGIFTDNYSWNVVPAPGAMALLAIAGLARRRRRRA